MAIDRGPVGADGKAICSGKRDGREALVNDALRRSAGGGRPRAGGGAIAIIGCGDDCARGAALVRTKFILLAFIPPRLIMIERGFGETWCIEAGGIKTTL